jgi:hypothetical protein
MQCKIWQCCVVFNNTSNGTYFQIKYRVNGHKIYLNEFLQFTYTSLFTVQCIDHFLLDNTVKTGDVLSYPLSAEDLD